MDGPPPCIRTDRPIGLSMAPRASTGGAERDVEAVGLAGAEPALAGVGGVIVVGERVDPGAGGVDPLRVGVVRRGLIVVGDVGGFGVGEHAAVERGAPLVALGVAIEGGGRAVGRLAVEVAGAAVGVAG